MTFWQNHRRIGKVSLPVYQTGRPMRRAVGKVARDPNNPFGSSGLSGSYIGSNFIDSLLAVFPFVDEPIGAEDSQRKIVVSIILSYDVAVARSVLSVTIGATSLTKAIQKNDASAAYYSVEQWYGAIPSGTTGTITVTANGVVQQCVIFVHRLVGAVASPSATAFDDTGATLSADINTLANSYTIGTYMDLARAHTVTWGGLSENAEVTGTELSAGVLASTASEAHAAASSPLTVTATPSAGSSGFTMVLSNWGPA